MNNIDVLGQIVVESVIDGQLEYFDLMKMGHWKAPALQNVQKRIMAMNKKDQETVRELLGNVLINAAHDLMFKIQENEVQIIVNGDDVVVKSDGLHGELFGENGWLSKFSKNKEKLQL